MTKNNTNTVLIIFFIIIIVFSRTSLAADYRYEACGPTNCSAGPNITFPFYFPVRQEPYCGYPGFELNCSSDGHPVLQLPRNEYVVEQISYQNRSFHVYDAVVLEPNSNNSCFPGIQNTTLPLPRFNFVSTPARIHLFSGCPDPLPEGLRRYNVSYCENWDLAIYDGDENLGNAMEMCETNVVAPVGDEGRIGNSNVSEVLRRGFDMNWTASDCNQCADSGGRCGFNTSNYHFRCFCPDMPHSRSCKPDKKRVALIASLASAGGVLVIAGLVCSFIFLYRKKRRDVDYLHSRNLLGIGTAKTRHEQDIELFLKKHGKLAQRRYKYSDLKKITKSFSENLGKGGYGSVYKGKLPDGRLVAVKVLSESKGNGEEFMNEVASISQTSHVNVVTLLGFSFEGSKRALIYDFMPNGSLEKHIQNNSASSSSAPGCRLGWEKLFEIALGIARGLDYLHQGCNMRILHFDIKPHNILLDKDFNPKISDFGLAKLCPNRSSIVSMMVARGTIGYIAPEVFSSNFGDVSYKSDVYSYGMMVLEIAGEKKRIDRGEVDRTSETYFPQYVYKQLELMGDVEGDGIMDEDGSELGKRKLIIIGLWCIQTHPKDRPSMSKVVEMLEGKIESLQVPPKPCLSSPPRFELNFSTTSQYT